MGGPPLPAFRLGDWLVDPSLNRLSRGGVVEHARPRLIELLVFLAKHAGQLVTKEQILDEVWQQRFVAESVLSRSVADLRQLLGDEAGQPRFIETIPKRGYRLVAAVSWFAARPAPLPEPSIVVLPFVDMAPGHDQEYFCDGLAEELTNGLAQLPGCRVVARTSAFAFKGRSIDVREIGRQLNVSTVLEGGVQRDGDRLRITVQLIDAESGVHVWSHRFDCTNADLFAVEDETVSAVVAALRVRMIEGREPSVIQGRTADPEAHDLYLRGRFLSARRSADALAEAARHFQGAIDRDRGYAAAHAAIAECHAVAAFMLLQRPSDAYPRARASAERALALAPDLADAHAVLGHELGMYEWRWREAEEHFRQAIALNPGHAMARVWYSHLLDAFGRFQDAIAQLERACECDPLAPTVRMSLGLGRYHAGDVGQAVSQYLKVLELAPSFLLARFQLGRAYGVLGRLEEAAEQQAKAAPAVPIALAFLASVQRRLGRIEQADASLAQLDDLSRTRYIGPFTRSCAYLWEPEQVTWLTRAFDEHEGQVPMLNVDPGAAHLRRNPVFRALLDRLGLPRVPVVPSA